MSLSTDRWAGRRDTMARLKSAKQPETRWSVRPRRPYALAPTLARFRRFPEAVDRVEGRLYRRLLLVDGSPLLLQVEQDGPPSRAVLQLRLRGRTARTGAARQAAQRFVERGLGAAVDVRPFYRALGRDSVLAGPIRAFRGLRVSGWPTLWETLVTAVLTQQVNLAFAFSIRRELALALGRRSRFDGASWVAFPTPCRVEKEGEDGLRRFRLSRAKARALHGLAAAFRAGDLSAASLESLSDEEAIVRLTEFRGVGRWTAEIALLRGMGRMDAFPAADLGVVKYVAQGLLGHEAPATEQEMRRFAERWRPYRGLALAYAYAELARREAQD